MLITTVQKRVKMKTAFLFTFICILSAKVYSQQRDSLDIELKNNIIRVNYNKRKLLITTYQQIDSFLNKNLVSLKNFNKTIIVLWVENTRLGNSDSIFNLIQKKYGINNFAYYSDRY